MWMKIIMCKLHLQVSGQYLIITIHFVKHNVFSRHKFHRIGIFGARGSFQLISDFGKRIRMDQWSGHAQSLQRTTSSRRAR